MNSQTNFKTGLAPLIISNSRALILGSMPGDLSLNKQVYYAHPRNIFWKIISLYAGAGLPSSQAEKNTLLEITGISLWDVCKSCVRVNSLDTAINGVVPNNINMFLESHPMIGFVLFNGRKAETLFNRYNTRLPHMQYFLLPSSSPANAFVPIEEKFRKWKEILDIVTKQKSQPV